MNPQKHLEAEARLHFFADTIGKERSLLAASRTYRSGGRCRSDGDSPSKGSFEGNADQDGPARCRSHSLPIIQKNIITASEMEKHDDEQNERPDVVSVPLRMLRVDSSVEHQEAMCAYICR